MSTSTVNIAFQTDFLREIDKIAAQESRSRSEFLREAARAYIERKRRWSSILLIRNRFSGGTGTRPLEPV